MRGFNHNGNVAAGCRTPVGGHGGCSYGTWKGSGIGSPKSVLQGSEFIFGRTDSPKPRTQLQPPLFGPGSGSRFSARSTLFVTTRGRGEIDLNPFGRCIYWRTVFPLYTNPVSKPKLFCRFSRWAFAITNRGFRVEPNFASDCNSLSRFATALTWVSGANLWDVATGQACPARTRLVAWSAARDSTNANPPRRANRVGP